MTWQVIFSARSRIDLQKIVEYIARDNSGAAVVVDHAGRISGEHARNGPGSATRFFPVGSYLIIYRLATKKRVVRVLRFWHSARRLRPGR